MISYIFIDGSYFVFYRYFSLIRWWKTSKQEELENYSENEIFVEKFKKIFKENIENLSKKLNIKNSDIRIIIGKDCIKENIWRKQLFKEYKENRKKNQDIKFFMKLAYDELFINYNIISHPFLEADDCIALYVKNKLNNENEIYIITSDKDYLQLSRENLYIYNLAFKELTKEKSSFQNPEKDLFCKIVMGDISDNISSVFSKCGIKTAEKYFNDKTFFENKLKNENAYDKFYLNQKLIDFNFIPEDIKYEFLQMYN